MDRATGTPQLVRKAGILGIGLDDGNGHTYITRGDDVLLLGGSEATHKLMQARVNQFEQALAARGKTLLDLTEAELSEIAAQLD
jgi:hypothetical protein